MSPSPIDLFARLSDEEKVAVDLVQSGSTGIDDQLAALVASESRRGYVRTLAMQLQALGFTLEADAGLDADVAMWAEAKARHQEELNAKLRDREKAAQADRAWLASLPASARRSVERRRRREARRSNR